MLCYVPRPFPEVSCIDREAMHNGYVSLPDADYLVVLCHGLDGDPSNLAALKEAITSALGPQKAHFVRLWDSKANRGGRMRDGIEACAGRLWSELLPLLKSKIALHDLIIRVSFVGHSLGGLILRALAGRLFVWCTDHGLGDRFAFDAYISIAVPHLGVRAIGDGVSGDGLVVGLIRSVPSGVLRAVSRLFTGWTSGSELLLESPTLLNTLTDDAGCVVLRQFACRLALSNVSGDWTVPYQSASLLDAEEAAIVRAAWRGEPARVLWSSAQVASIEPRLLPTMRLIYDAAHLDGVRTLVVTKLPEVWNPAPTAAQHANDSDAGDKDPLAAQTSAILRRLRACGDWEVHAVEFGDRATTLLGMRLPHIDIAAIPGQRTSDAGLEVAGLVARRLLLQLAREPSLLLYSRTTPVAAFSGR